MIVIKTVEDERFGHGKWVQPVQHLEFTDEDGKPIHGLRSVDIRIRPDEIVTAECKINVAGLEISAVEEKDLIVERITNRVMNIITKRM